MDRRDLQIIPDTDGEVTFAVVGSRSDSGLLLLQRLYTLLFAPHGTEYRAGMSGYDLLSLLDGANTPSDDVMNTLVSVCRSHALEALDDDDRSRVAEFTCECIDGKINCTLVLSDGNTITGTIDYA